MGDAGIGSKLVKADGAAVRILVIDDDPFITSIYVLKLRHSGIEVAQARDGMEGLKVASEFRPDIILLDILMPNLDGFETLKRLKKDKSLKAIPVIILSNLAHKEDIEQGIKIGATDYLIKTQTLPTDCLKKIRAVLGV
jgi:DNA-binding response OmpR family regulator